MNRFWRFWLWLTKPAMLVSWLGSSRRPVAAPEARRRVLMCGGCPNSVRQSKVPPVVARALKQVAGLRHKLGCTLPETTENFCRGCGCQIAMKVWVPYEHIKAWQRTEEIEKIRAVKPDCWQL